MACCRQQTFKKLYATKSGTLHPPWIRHKGEQHQIFNFKRAAKSQTSSPTQPQLRLGDLEILLQMGHALHDSEATNCISKMKMKKQRLRCLKITAYKCLRDAGDITRNVSCPLKIILSRTRKCHGVGKISLAPIKMTRSKMKLAKRVVITEWSKHPST